MWGHQITYTLTALADYEAFMPNDGLYYGDYKADGTTFALGTCKVNPGPTVSAASDDTANNLAETIGTP